MRRADRAVDSEEALRILNDGEYGILSTVGLDAQPYGVPVNYCVIGDQIYFHCAVKGHKLDNISHNPKVSFCVVGETRILSAKFGSEYESTIVFGHIAEVYGDEKREGLEGLLHKYSSRYFEEGLKYIDALNEKARVFKIAIEAISGKARKQAR